MFTNFSKLPTHQILNNAAFILFWGVLLGGTGPLAGYTMEDIMLIWALASSGFIVFVPLHIIRSFDWLLLVILFAVTIVYAVIGYCFFLWGLKRYESGNLMTTRL